MTVKSEVRVGLRLGSSVRGRGRGRGRGRVNVGFRLGSRGPSMRSANAWGVGCLITQGQG